MKGHTVGSKKSSLTAQARISMGVVNLSSSTLASSAAPTVSSFTETSASSAAPALSSFTEGLSSSSLQTMRAQWTISLDKKLLEIVEETPKFNDKIQWKKIAILWSETFEVENDARLYTNEQLKTRYQQLNKGSNNIIDLPDIMDITEVMDIPSAAASTSHSIDNPINLIVFSQEPTAVNQAAIQNTVVEASSSNSQYSWQQLQAVELESPPLNSNFTDAENDLLQIILSKSNDKSHKWNIIEHEWKKE
jgi:hypothetical protein